MNGSVRRLRQASSRWVDWRQWIACCMICYDLVYLLYSIASWLFYAIFWPPPLSQWRRRYLHADTFAAWQEAADALNQLLLLSPWRFDARSRHYNRELIMGHIAAIDQSIVTPDSFIMSELFRSGLHRNLGNISTPRLYRQCFGRTKFVIEEFAGKMVTLLHLILRLPEQQRRGRGDDAAWMPKDMKMDFVVASKRSLGSSSLFLEGGAIFGLCHLGVTKALFDQGLLLRNITGVATGALIASLIATTSPQNLPNLLRGEGIDLSALSDEDRWANTWTIRLFNLLKRMARYCRKGYFWDVDVLEECAFANLGDITFEEAHDRTGMILNIIVPVPGDHGVPILINYLTAPNVLIWTATVASNSVSQSFTGGRRTMILCKNHRGQIVPWDHSELDSHPHDRMRPLDIISRAFNVNHFVVSQARPYVLPFIQSDMSAPDLYGGHSKIMRLVKYLAHIVGGEIHLRMTQMNELGILPTSIRQIFMDVDIKQKPSITIVPNVQWKDYSLLLDIPTQDTIRYWINKGEWSTWPSICALRIRLQLEMELEKAYMMFRHELPENDAFL